MLKLRVGKFKGACMAKSKRKKKLRFIIKIILCLTYLLIGFILVFCAYELYENDQKIISWAEVENTKQYSYIEISQMSEAFAVIKKDQKQIHFVIEQERDKSWHTYLVAIKKSDYEKYRSIIDYTYERTKEKPKSLKIYGYPVKISNNIKLLAIKNIKNFVPIENQVVLTKNNFEKYLTDTYLDTTQPKNHNLNYIIITLLLMTFVLFILIIFTILDKDKIVDEVDSLLEKEIDETNKKKKKKKSYKGKLSNNKRKSSNSKHLKDSNDDPV